MKKQCIAAGLAVSLALGTAAVTWAGAKQIIRIDGGKRTEINMEEKINGQLTESLPDSSAQDVQDMETEGAGWEPIRLWGLVTEAGEGSFVLDNQAPESSQGEVIIHFDPEKTLLIDSTTGYPAEKESLLAGQMVYVYVSPAMTLSLPPQTTAEIVFVNVPQDAAAPEYFISSAPLSEDGQGGFLLTSIGGGQISVLADCTIIPYLTRQMVRLEDIDKGRRGMVWKDAEGRAEKIVLFNE